VKGWFVKTLVQPQIGYTTCTSKFT